MEFEEVFKRNSELIIDLQRKMIINFGEMIPANISAEEQFLICSISITFIISSFLNSFGVKTANRFMEELTHNVIELHKKADKYSSYVAFKDNKKVFESRMQ